MTEDEAIHARIFQKIISMAGALPDSTVESLAIVTALFCWVIKLSGYPQQQVLSRVEEILADMDAQMGRGVVKH